MLEARILTLEEKLRSATVVDSKDITTDVVGVGTAVNVKDEKSRQVGDSTRSSARPRPTRPRRSSRTSRPSASALIGQKKGDKVVGPAAQRLRAQAEDPKIDVGS